MPRAMKKPSSVTGKSSRSTLRSTTKSTRNTGAPWTREDDRELRQLVRGNTPTRVIGLKLGRSETAVRSHASRLGVSLRPANQSPYG